MARAYTATVTIPIVINCYELAHYYFE